MTWKGSGGGGADLFALDSLAQRKCVFPGTLDVLGDVCAGV